MGDLADKYVKEPLKAALSYFVGPWAGPIVDVIWFAASTAAVAHASAEYVKSQYKGLSEESQGRLLNSRVATAPQQYVYGKVRKGGTIVNTASGGSNNKYLHMIIALAGHEVNSISNDVYVNDELTSLSGNSLGGKWKDKIRIDFYKGNHTAGPTDWPTGDIGVGYGVAYAHVRFEYNKTVFADGIPQITFLVEGKKVYDPRDSNQDADDASTWTYSANPALCIADYIRADYGLADSKYSRIDDTKLQIAANVCDENITLAAGGTEKQYELNGVVDASNTPADNIGRMLTSCNGTLYWGSGKWKITAASYTTPVKTLTLDDFRSEISLATRASAADSYNAVTGTFIDAGQNYISVDFAKVSSTTFLFEDNNVENVSDLSLPFTTSASMAQRLAKQSLFRNREQITVNASFGMKAFDLEVGDIVRLTIDRYGWSEKEFIVNSWTILADPDQGDIQVGMSLKEISSAAFDWNAEETEIISNNTTLPKYDDPVSFSFTPSFEASSATGSFKRDLIIDLTSSNIERIENCEVQIRRSRDDDGDIDVTGLVDKIAVIRGLAASDPVFDLVTGSRKVGDLNNDGVVDGDDADIYQRYYFKETDLDNDNDVDTDDATLKSRINLLNIHIYSLYPDRFSSYLHAYSTRLLGYTTVYTGSSDQIRVYNQLAGRFDIRVKVHTKLGFVSDWVYHKRFEIPFSDKEIGAPKEAFASPSGSNSLELFWKESKSPSLSHYEIRHSKFVHGEEVTTGNFIAGHHYEITNVGDTDFTEIGASSNTVGVEFWCHSDGETYTSHAVGGGTTGKAKNVIYIDKTVSWVDKVSAPANSVTTSPKSGTYLIRAFSEATTPSFDYLRVPLTASEFDNPYSSSSTTNVWNTSGDYSEIEVQTGSSYYPTGFYSLVSANVFAGTQVFTAHNTIDIGSVQEARCTIDADFIRLNQNNKTSETIDEAFGDVDNIGVNWDDIEYEMIGNFSFVGFVRVSDDNSTYSGWQRLTSNIVKGRYFQFKVEIETQYNAGPSFRQVSSVTNVSSGVSRITTNDLVAKVEY